MPLHIVQQRLKVALRSRARRVDLQALSDASHGPLEVPAVGRIAGLAKSHATLDVPYTKVGPGVTVHGLDEHLVLILFLISCSRYGF